MRKLKRCSGRQLFIQIKWKLPLKQLRNNKEAAARQ